MSRIESTYKARDVEEPIDLYFYRPVGYAVAHACRFIGITPNTVTILSIIIGVAGGHLLYYQDLTINVWGIILWVVADIFDSVDGQLARLTNHKSKFGRILDGVGGNIIFLSIYLHLFARMTLTYDMWWGWLLALILAAGVSHSIQSALADYYRNAYLKFVVDAEHSELDGTEDIRAAYKAIAFARDPFSKILLRIYLSYTVVQESLSKNFQHLREIIAAEYGNRIPSWFSDEYRRLNKPLMKYYAILTTNTRMIILAICVCTDWVPLYFAIEIVGINLLMVIVTLYQERLSSHLLLQIAERKAGK